MAQIPNVETSTRRLETMPERRFARSIWGEAGREIGYTGRVVGGALSHIADAREREARAADADARRNAELNDALAENFIANAAVGREVVDEATGERRFVPGKFAKTWSEMKAEGTDSVKLTRGIIEAEHIHLLKARTCH